jgi:hypothetical protein
LAVAHGRREGFSCPSQYLGFGGILHAWPVQLVGAVSRAHYAAVRVSVDARTLRLELLEIGAGTGVLAAAILAASPDQLTAVEVDQRPKQASRL